MDGMKAKLPHELKAAMQLDDDQFEELEADTLDACMRFLPLLSEFVKEPVDMDTAWRPTRNPRDQYFGMIHSIMVDPNDKSVRHDIKAFKPMSKSEYRTYCLTEFGSDPFVDPSLN
jgi:hypothetical protein